MNHMNVATTQIPDFAADCQKTFAILNQRCGEVKHFAFPYGRYFHFSESARKVVFDTGFNSCASAERGCHANGLRPINLHELFIRRDHVLLDWKTDHIMHFLLENSKNADFEQNFYEHPKEAK